MSHLHHQVSALIDGELGPRARARALRHVQGCAVCRREIAETLHLKERLSQLPAAEVSAEVRALVAAGSGVEPDAPGPGVGPAVRRVVVSLGSTSVFVFALAYVVGAPQANQAATITPPVNEFTAEFTETSGLGPLSDPPVDTVAAASNTTAPINFSTSLHAAASNVTQLHTTPSGMVSTGAGAASEVMAVTLLRRAVSAPDRVSFRGLRRCHSYGDGGSESFTVAVRHVAGQGTSYQIRDAGHAERAMFIGEPTAAGVAAANQAITRLAAAYHLAVSGAQRLLGRAVTVVSATSGGQLSARFWVDNATGLVLRRNLYVDGSVVRRSEYLSFKTFHHGFMARVPPELTVPTSHRLSTQIAAALTDRGWTYPALLGGSFRLSALRELGSRGRVMSADYTDGMSTLSVFEERGTLDAQSLHGFRPVHVGDRVFYVREGMPMTVVWQSGDLVLTVVTDLPVPMTASLVSGFPASDEPAMDGSDGHSLPERVGTGLSRLISAVAP